MVSSKVLEAYEAEGIEYRTTAEDRNQARFNEVTRNTKDTIQTTVDQVYRYRNGKGQEFLYFQITKTGTDFIGNPVQCTDTIGRDFMPVFRREVDPQTGNLLAAEVVDTKPDYSIPFSKEAYEKEIAPYLTERTSFVLTDGVRKRGGFTPEEFVSYGFTDLIAFNEKGVPLPKPAPVPTKKG